MSDSVQQDDLGKTTLRRIEQYRDRWTSDDADTGLVEISGRLSATELREFDLFADYDDNFLEKISPDVSVARWREGAVLFEEGTYIDLAFFVVDGEVEVFVEGLEGAPEGPPPIFDLSRTVIEPRGEAAREPSSKTDGEVEPGTVLMRRSTRVAPSEITFLATMDFDLPRGVAVRLGAGEIFGEIGSMSGWPQSVTARTTSECRLVQLRVPALRLMKRKSKDLKKRLDALYRERSLATQLKRTPIFSGCNDIFIEALKEKVELVSCDPGEVIVSQGGPAGDFFVVRSGFVRLSQSFGEGEIVVSYLSKGMNLGEVELLVDEVEDWQVTAASVEYAELIKIPREIFEQLLHNYPKTEIAHAEFTEVALETGLVQGNSILAIDLNACTRCDDCVRACAATHGGRSRFIREGDKVQNLLIARSCYHCRDPVCLVGCPTGAIHRAGVGDVVAVDEEVCIGCSNCARNCPYDAIVMHEMGSVWPDDMVPQGLRGRDREMASKCDLCLDTGHGPACVSNCPQGCAYRIGSLEEFQDLLSGKV
jgi:CRP-like cAMP-binding protein/Fe-S-cluster-containing hydrogenase component 2